MHMDACFHMQRRARRWCSARVRGKFRCRHSTWKDCPIRTYAKMQDMCVSCAQVVLSMLIKLGQVKVCTCKCYRSMRAREVLDCKANSSPPKTSDGVCLGERAWDALGAENLTPTSSFFNCNQEEDTPQCGRYGAPQ